MTQEIKHTPAPWETGQVSWDEDTKEVRYTLHGVYEAKVADALLIAAAPELLTALENLLYSRALGNQDDIDKAIKKAHEVLLKAKGISDAN